MKLKEQSAALIIGVVVFVIGLSAIILQRYYPNVITLLTNLNLNSPEEKKESITIGPDLEGNNYSFSQDFFEIPNFDEQLSGSDFRTYQIQVIFTNDDSFIGHKFNLAERNSPPVYSGSGYSVDRETKTAEIYIMIDPSLSREQRLHEVNTNYLVGMLLANERAKSIENLRNPSDPIISEIIELAHQTAMQASIAPNYPIIYETQ